jgi:antirestriction protein ArdC
MLREKYKGQHPMSKFRANKSYTERRDHCQEVTDRIVAALESGTKPWQRPWDQALAGGPAMPINAATGKRYHGINVLVLAMSAFAFGNGDPRFCSYKQANDRGWQVRRGEKGTTVFFFKRLEVVDSDASPDAEDGRKSFPLLRSYTVFNGAQLDGIPPYVAPELVATPWRRPEAAELILQNSGAHVRIGGDKAFYSPSLDFIQIPADNSFISPQSWASVMLHELAHWSGAPNRLNREIKNRFGSDKYALEELRAELASVFIGAELGLPCDIPNHASYVASWIDTLRQDEREIFRAAADAQRIADLLLSFHPDYAAQNGTAPGTDDETSAPLPEDSGAVTTAA